jgi:predicted ATPase/DNA-binding SARP family transcriptional activator
MTRDEIVAPLAIRLFGQFDVRCDGAPLKPLRSRKGGWLLALLALRQGRAVEREWLAGTLWPDSLESDALYSLRRSLADLRQAMGVQGARITGPTMHTLCLETEGVFVDAIAFDESVRRGDRAGLERAVSLYRGPLLEGCAEEWALVDRTAREQACLQALEALAKLALDAAAPTAAVVYLERLLAVDPLQESATRLLMQAHAGQGNYALMVQTYRQLRLRLRSDLNTDPDPETVALYSRLRAAARSQSQREVTAAAPASSPAAAPPLPASPPMHSLPRSTDPLIGREQDLEEVIALLSSARLVTLTGIGGVGKTRLALAAAEATAEEYRDDACLVELADVLHARDAPAALGLALGLKPAADGELQEAILNHLRPQQLLLLLDNFEQVVDAAPYVSLLLQNCPQVTCLVTSRQLLQIRGEHEFGVEPLPPPGQNCTLEELSHCASVQLFLARAQAARADFRLGEANWEAVAEICRRLEGLPLALELTAGLSRGLTPQQLLPRLRDRFRLLTTAQRDLTARQRSLRGALDWSYELLPEPERTLFTSLSVFAGGFIVEAVEAVCAEEEAFALLLALRDKSLLRATEVGGEMRYVMLETLRDYAREKRAGMPDEAILCERHADYYLSQAQRWGASVWSGDEEAEISGRCFEIELPNIRTGMDWATERRDAGRVVPYAIALFRFLFTRGLYTEAEAQLLAAEEVVRNTDAQTDLAGLLNRRGMIAWNRSEYVRAQALFTESYEISKAKGDDAQALLTLPNLGNVAWVQLDYSGAQRMWEEALALAIGTGRTDQEALLRSNLGILAMDQGAYGPAERQFLAALALFQQDGQQAGAAETLCILAELCLKQGRADEARIYVEDAQTLYTTLGNQPLLSWALVLAGRTLLAGSHLDSARKVVNEALAISTRHGNRRCEMLALEALADIAAAGGDRQGAQSAFHRWYEIARQTRVDNHMLESLFHYGLWLHRNGEMASAYRLLIMVAERYGHAGIADGQIAAECCAEIRTRLSQEEIARLDAEAAPLSPENALLPVEAGLSLSF